MPTETQSPYQRIAGLLDTAIEKSAAWIEEPHMEQSLTAAKTIRELTVALSVAAEVDRRRA